jgi:hypothetical protein
MVSGSSTQLGDIIEFDVIYEGESIGGGIPNGSSTLVASCDSVQGFFPNSICNVLVYLFVPPRDSLYVADNVLNTLKVKPPIGYFYLISAALSGITTSTATSSLISPSTTAAISLAVSPLRSTLSWILWILALAWLGRKVFSMDI